MKERAFRRHGWMMGAAFAVGVGSFIASTSYTDAQLRDIEPEAQVIAERTIPAILHLSALRAELRDVDSAVEDELDQKPHAREQGDRAMRAADFDLAAYLATPREAEQEGRAANVTWSYERVKHGLDDVRTRIDRDDLPGARAQFDSGLRFYVQQADDVLVDVTTADAQGSRAAALRVAEERRRARAIAFTLDGLCLAASLAFGMLVFLKIRRDERAVLEERAATLAHA